MCIPGDDPRCLMRLGLTSLVFTIALLASPAMGQPIEVTTAPDAILCLSRENVAVANKLAVAKIQAELSAIGCLRVEAGIRSRLLETVAASGPVQVGYLSGRYQCRFGALGPTTFVPGGRPHHKRDAIWGSE